MKKIINKKINFIIAIIITCLFSTILSGCSNNEADSNENNNVINVFNCGDYINEDLITKFQDETGYKIQYSTYDTNEIMYSKLKSGSSNYDLVFPSDYMIEKMISEDMIQKIDFDNIPNYKYIDDEYKNLSYDPQNEYSVPYMWGTIGIIYNPQYVKEPVTSFDILWDKKYDKEIIMFNSVRDTMAISLKRLGYSMNSTNHDEIKEASDELIKQKPIVKAWFVDQVKDAMINNEAYLATVWSGDAMYIMSENPSLKYVVPESGSNKWFDAMCIPSNAKNKEGAEAFINFLTDPENSKENVDYIGYYTPNKVTYEMLDDEIKENYPSKELLDKCEIFRNLDKKTLEFYDDEWIRIGSF